MAELFENLTENSWFLNPATRKVVSFRMTKGLLLFSPDCFHLLFWVPVWDTMYLIVFICCFGSLCGTLCTWLFSFVVLGPCVGCCVRWILSRVNWPVFCAAEQARTDEEELLGWAKQLGSIRSCFGASLNVSDLLKSSKIFSRMQIIYGTLGLYFSSSQSMVCASLGDPWDSGVPWSKKKTLS